MSITVTAEHRSGPDPDPLRGWVFAARSPHKGIVMTAATLAPPAVPAPTAPRRDPRWARPALAGLLGATALLYGWGLGASGYGNTFYSAAVQAGATSWKAFLLGSSDAANSIMVDKPPASLWVAELAVRIFGLSPWSVLVPQALEGVAAVGVLYAAVRRWHGPAAGLLAGAVLALTPVAVLMFRFNNPDALLVLLLVLGGYALVRALEAGRPGWLVAAAVFIGFGFLTKMMQAFLVVPGFMLTYLVAAPVAARRRIWQLLVAGVVLVASSGWWVAIVELWPAADRPYVGSSQTNSVLELIFGYNGFGRLTGNEVGSVGRDGFAGGPRGPGGVMSGGGGVRQLFDWSMGSQIAWLLPAALLFLLTLLWVGRRMPRTDRLRASMLLWGGWLLVTGAVLSYAQGIIHPYYTVALAPAIGALVGIGAVTLWQLRSRLLARAVLSGGLAGTAVWAFLLLDRAPSWQPWLRVVVLIAGLVCAVVLAVPATARSRVGLVVVAAGVVLGLAAPSAYALDTAATPHHGAIPSAGPPPPDHQVAVSVVVDPVDSRAGDFPVRESRAMGSAVTGSRVPAIRPVACPLSAAPQAVSAAGEVVGQAGSAVYWAVPRPIPQSTPCWHATPIATPGWPLPSARTWRPVFNSPPGTR